MGLTMIEATVADGPVSLRGESLVPASVVDEHGCINAGALFTMADCIGGFAGGLGALPDGWVVTTNMMIRSVAVRVEAPLILTSTVLRKGKNSVITAVNAVDSAGEFVAAGTLTSAVLIPAGGVPTWNRPARIDLHASASTVHFNDWLGITPTEIGVELQLVDDLRNPWGIMHGGVTSALVDHAATTAVCRSLGGTRRDVRTNDVALHFLAPAKTGPVRASGRVLGTRPDGTLVEIEVRDAGNDDRLVALAVATVGPVPT